MECVNVTGMSKEGGWQESTKAIEKEDTECRVWDQPGL